MEAHKVIIAACSPFFKSILRRNPHQHPLIYLKGVKFSDLGSILNFVGQLPEEEGRLLIMHGTMDENVHFMQHTAQLINLLVKHGKPYQLQVVFKFQ